MTILPSFLGPQMSSQALEHKLIEFVSSLIPFYQKFQMISMSLAIIIFWEKGYWTYSRMG
jgi:hypothetical protein